MQTRETYFSVRPFFAHALAATLAVTILPVLLVFALVAISPTMPTFLVAAIGVFLSVGAMAAGNAMWNTRIESTEIGFSDLMLWRWFIRRRAEDTLEEGARLLGLDRSGQPVDDIRILPDQQLQVLKDLTTALESKDPYTHGHSQRVERHAYRTAAAMHLSIHDIEDLRKAAALHDVGKIRVPDRILRKPEQLTIEERVLMEEHSVVGAWMVSSVSSADVIAAVRHHHERWDGKGYPDGVAGAVIPLYARIIAVADAYDAITSTRPYRSSSGRDDAVDVLRAGAGSQFDPEVVEAFIAALPARLPVTAGLFLILGGAPQRLMRAFASWLKRMGAGNLTPAVGAAGAAVVLGASFFAPKTVAPIVRQPEIAAPAQSQPEASVDALPKAPRKKKNEPESRPAPRLVKSRNDGTIVLAAQLHRDAPEQEQTEAEVVLLQNEAEPAESPSPENEPTPQPSQEPTSRRNSPDEDDEPEPSPSPSPRNKNDGRDGCMDGNAGGGNDAANCGEESSTNDQPSGESRGQGHASTDAVEPGSKSKDKADKPGNGPKDKAKL